MKYFSTLLVLTASILFSYTGYAQKAIPLNDCTDSAMTRQADSIKDVYEKQGFILLKETSVSMENQYELPIVLPLNKGDWYQFIFIGDASSLVYEVRMYDWNEKQIQYIRKNFGDPSYNIIDYSYVPDESQYYMIKPLQVNKKKKKMCGYVMLLKRTR
jgi:hypothetical protein